MEAARCAEAFRIAATAAESQWDVHDVPGPPSLRALSTRIVQRPLACNP